MVALLVAMLLVVSLMTTVPPIGAGPAPAGLLRRGPVPSADAADMLQGWECRMFDGFGRNTHTHDTFAVQNAHGGWVARCTTHGVLPAQEGHTVHFTFANTGQECVTPFGTTRHWHEVLTVHGGGTMICTSDGI